MRSRDQAATCRQGPIDAPGGLARSQFATATAGIGRHDGNPAVLVVEHSDEGLAVRGEAEPVYLLVSLVTV